MLFLSPLPRGVRGRVRTDISIGNRGLLADSGPDLGWETYAEINKYINTCMNKHNNTCIYSFLCIYRCSKRKSRCAQGAFKGYRWPNSHCCISSLAINLGYGAPCRRFPVGFLKVFGARLAHASSVEGEAWRAVG